MAAETPGYVPVDDLPEVAAARQEVRSEAWALVRLRERQLAARETPRLPLAIDALSTAEHALQAAAYDGLDSESYQERLAGLELDCQRLVAEWYRKNRPEYFPPSRHFFDAETGDFYSHGLSVRQMTENALRPLKDDPEEVERRVNERVEDATPQILRKIGGVALQSLGLRTISECTDKAINDYEADMAASSPHRGYGGYVPEIKKLMIRDMRFDEASGDRLEEQVGLPGIYINHYVIQEALRRCGVEAGQWDKTTLHGRQLLVGDDLIEFVALLDQVASEEWCTDIFMGEPVSPSTHKDYAVIRQEALERQSRLSDVASTVAVFILDLAADGFDRRRAPAMVELFVKKLLLNMAKQDISLAAQIFDERTAAGLQAVAVLEADGRREAAFDLYQAVEKEAPGGGYCSGGSCGLESVDVLSDEGKDLAKRLKAKPGDTIVKDKERSCRCGKKSVVYAYNKDKVNKYCQSCKAFESKRMKAK